MRSNFNEYSQNRELKRYLKEIEKSQFLTQEEEKILIEKIEKGDLSAKEKLITSNLKIVVAIARRYSCSKIPTIDLINDGNIGLMQSIKKFDSTKGVRFITFAYPYIKGAILAGIYDNYSLIRIPRHQWLNQEGKKTDKIIENLNLGSTLENEINEKSKGPASKQFHFSTSVNSFNELSDNNPIFETNYELQKCPEKLNNLIIAIISQLSEKEQYIIKASFGLDGIKEVTYETMGAKFGISRERIRIIRKNALTKLRKMVAHLEAEDIIEDSI